MGGSSLGCASGRQMSAVAAFSVLAPDLDVPARRLLKVMLQRADLEVEGTDFHGTLEACPTRHVLSVGKAALDVWHDFGLIQVGAHHGCMFRHWTPNIGHRAIMVLHHPGSAMQMSFGGYEARDQIQFDLARWRGVIGGQVDSRNLCQMTCGRCLGRRRNPARRPAQHWVEELDGCGLCEDCYRARSKITRKTPKKPNRSKPEAQIAGQLEMIADGRRVLMPKR